MEFHEAVEGWGRQRRRAAEQTGRPGYPDTVLPALTATVPPSRLEWLIDSHLRGHTPAETIAYASWKADYADELAGSVRCRRTRLRPALSRGG